MPDSGQKARGVYDFLRTRSSAWLAAPSLSCAFHPERAAIATCAVCGRPLCESCAFENASRNHCSVCRGAIAKASLLRKILSAFCQPVLWVFLCIAVAAGLYSLGVGNPGIAEMSKMDSAKEWHMQEAPKVFLAQGARERRRAAVLAGQGNAAEAARWYALASGSYAKSASLWGEAPSAFAPALAAAETLSLSGHPAEALSSALKIKAPEAESDLMDFHFVMGRIASAAGDDALARRHFKEAHAKASIAKESAMDGIIAALSGDRREATFAAKVRIVSGLNAKPEDVIFKCRQYVEAKGVKGDDAEDLKPKKTERKPTQEDDFQIEILQPKGGAR